MDKIACEVRFGSLAVNEGDIVVVPQDVDLRFFKHD